MRRLSVALLLAFPLTARAESQWVLVQSTLTYHVSHPLHEVEGVSHEARGKGICHSSQCDFLIAVPVKSFDSGDSNRDLHMLQVTRGDQFPLVSVRTRLPEEAAGSTTIHADLEIQFAGQTATYRCTKTELAEPSDNAAAGRNYSYILQPIDDQVFAAIPGKLTLSFALAVNAYKIITGNLPTAIINPGYADVDVRGLVPVLQHAEVARRLLKRLPGAA